jgi:hypothetical protein
MEVIPWLLFLAFVFQTVILTFFQSVILPRPTNMGGSEA